MEIKVKFTRLPLSQICGHYFKDLVYGDSAMVTGFNPSTRMWSLSGKYPGGLPDIWDSPSLEAYGIEPEFTREELERIEECRTTNILIAKATELKVAIENWFAAPHLR